MATKHLTTAALAAFLSFPAHALDLRPYVEGAVGPAYVYGETKGGCEPNGHGYRCHYEPEREINLGGRVAAGVEIGMFYIEAEHTSVIGEKDTGTDALWFGLRWRAE